jgi:hypothetical protein
LHESKSDNARPLHALKFHRRHTQRGARPRWQYSSEPLQHSPVSATLLQ